MRTAGVGSEAGCSVYVGLQLVRVIWSDWIDVGWSECKQGPAKACAFFIGGEIKAVIITSD